MAAEWVWQDEEWVGQGTWTCHNCRQPFPAVVHPLMRMYAEGLGWCLCPNCAELPPRPSQWDMTFDQLGGRHPEKTISVQTPGVLSAKEEIARAAQQQEEDKGQWHSFAVAPGAQWYIDGEPLP